MTIKASNNLIHVNPHQFAALLTRGGNRFVSVIGANDTGRELIVRLLGTLMQEFNPKWAPMYCQEKADVVPVTDLPKATFAHSFEPVELAAQFVEYDDCREYTVSRGTLDDIEFDDPDAPGLVMVIKDPDAFIPQDGTSFQLFTQHDGFTYATGLGYREAEDGAIELRINTIMQRSIVQYLPRPLVGEPLPTPIDLWLDVQYKFMVGCHEFFNSYLADGETLWGPIEDFRRGVEFDRLIETNCFPPNATALMTVKKNRRDKKEPLGSDGDDAIKAISAVTELEFTRVPERYGSTIISGVRIAKDPAVAAEFVCYLVFKLEDGAIEEQVVISGNDFDQLYAISLRLANRLRVRADIPDDLSSTYLS